MAQDRLEESASDFTAHVDMDDAKSRAARIKKPPFGMKAPPVPAIPGLSSDITVPQTAAQQPQPLPVGGWWYESGKAVTAAGVISAAWGGIFAIYITAAVGWDQLFTLLPDQFGSLIATFVLPLAFLWVVIAYLDRGRDLRRESAALRAHLAQLTYPSADGEARVNAITDSLKAQTAALTAASDNAVRQMQKLQSIFLRDTEKLAVVTGTLEACAANMSSSAPPARRRSPKCIPWDRRSPVR
jgi:hypothetical protein